MNKTPFLSLEKAQEFIKDYPTPFHIYDEKGISYPRITSKPAKIPENEFAPVSECFDQPDTYCAFWCAEAFSLSAAKGIYQIAAVRVRSGAVADEFQELIRPWDGIAGRKDAAKKAGVDLSAVESAEDVDLVMRSLSSLS